MSRAGRHATPKGDARREQIVAAAAAILEREGFDAVSHRAVAREAGVPLGSVSYYLGDRDALVAAGVERFAGRWQERADRAAAAEPDPARRIVLLVAGGGSGAELVTIYERYVQAARHPSVAEQTAAWTARLVEGVAAVLEAIGADRAQAQRFLAVVDGLLVCHLAAADPLAAATDEVAAMLAEQRR